MSNQPNNVIQQISTSKELREHLPTKTNASEQAVQNLTEEQLENVAGGGMNLGFIPRTINKVATKVATNPHVAKIAANPHVAQILTKFKI